MANSTEKMKRILTSLTDDELRGVPPVSPEEIARELEKGRKEQAAVEANSRPVPVNSKILFR